MRLSYRIVSNRSLSYQCAGESTQVHRAGAPGRDSSRAVRRRSERRQRRRAPRVRRRPDRQEGFALRCAVSLVALICFALL